jgi:predicted acyl esterase
VALDQLVYENMIQERDAMVPMRDGVRLAVDVCR